MAATSAPKKKKLLIPRGSKFEDSMVYIAVNGVGYTIPRGKEVEVPVEIYDEYMRSQDALNYFYDASIAMQEDAVNQAKEAGL